MTTLTSRSTKGSALTHAELDANFDKAAQTKAAAYTIAVSDNRDTIEYTGSGSESFTLPDAATVAAASDTGDFEVTIKHIGTGVLTITCTTGTDVIDESTADITLDQYESVTLKVNQSGDGYNTIAHANQYRMIELLPATSVGTGQSYELSTAVPSWVKRMTVGIIGISTNGTEEPRIHIGDSGGYETSVYRSSVEGVSADPSTTGFVLSAASSSTHTLYGSLILTLIDASTNTWACVGGMHDNGSLQAYFTHGTKSLSAPLDRIRIFLSTDNFDAGSVSLLIEG